MEEFAKIRVGHLVEDDKAGVHRVAALGKRHIDGMGVPAHIVVAFINGQVVVPVEQIRGGQP